MFTLTIETDNAAFGADGNDEEQRCMDQAVEVARILRRAAQSVEDGAGYGSLRDVNGNTCGKFNFS